MVASPRKRERLEAGEPRHPWKEDPSLSSRPPFEPGNTESLVHGANSPRSLQPIAERLEEEIVQTAPWLSRPAFRLAVTAWAWSEAACELYREWFATVGLFDSEGAPVSGLANWDRCEARASKLRARLSLDPSALAKLIGQLSTASAAGVHARAEIVALEREASELDAQIARTLERKELE